MSFHLSPQGVSDDQSAQPLAAPMKRRSFFQYAGATASVAALTLAGCSDDDPDDPTTPAVTTVDVGGADTGVLNLAYALEQLEWSFYTAVRAGSYYSSLATGSAEKQVLDDILKHEQVHLNFLRANITTAAVLKALEFDFAAIDFTARTTAAGSTRLGVLNAAMAFEDLGVAAYNGAARFLTSPQTLLMLGKIVSVEARHAALIRDLISYNTFVGADVVDVFAPAASGVPGDGTGTGLERLKTPTQVIALVNPYLKEGSKLTATKLV